MVKSSLSLNPAYQWLVGNATFNETGSYILLRRFTLPGERAHDLLWLLRRDGVSASSVWPGYQGVADELKVFHRALTGAEILALYLVGRDGQTQRR